LAQTDLGQAMAWFPLETEPVDGVLSRPGERRVTNDEHGEVKEAKSPRVSGFSILLFQTHPPPCLTNPSVTYDL
jgi:hypothetical protein